MKPRGHKPVEPYKEVVIPSDGDKLTGDLFLPRNASAVVIFAHGSGSGRKSPRNRQTAHAVQEMGIGTLLFDLLTAREEGVDILTGEYRFNIDLLSRRLMGATAWLDASLRACKPAIGYFGASTGAAAALTAAAAQPSRIAAIVSRGGRPDMAGTALGLVVAPTLLIVGGNDPEVLELNKTAYQRIHADKELKIIPGATHLFEEPGTLEQASRLAAQWFSRFLLEA